MLHKLIKPHPFEMCGICLIYTELKKQKQNFGPQQNVSAKNEKIQ